MRRHDVLRGSSSTIVWCRARVSFRDADAGGSLSADVNRILPHGVADDTERKVNMIAWLEAMQWSETDHHASATCLTMTP
ncbi:protein of unknown function [Candidatus Filomicrobium marinum]|uniref:Uncharacterized protein n=1 Tax=Candidatus Filomicrobium marinum TaxID=1608628 RepID=A0A0D6JC15_9HYPH|nr:protein of unknown function [Candidatus Filomicrobium marinum]CPR16186.1 protein of unknown function [Candidatus Filomicrobium marinum]